VSTHPDVTVLDPIENMMRLSDRRLQYQFVKDCDVVDESRFSRLHTELVMPIILLCMTLCMDDRCDR